MFVFWTAGQTKQVILKSHRELWELVVDVSQNLLTFKNQKIQLVA